MAVCCLPAPSHHRLHLPCHHFLLKHHPHFFTTSSSTTTALVTARYAPLALLNPISADLGVMRTGLIAGLLAQGWPADLALIGGVHLHGLAGDRLVALGKGPNGLTAGEVIESARAAFNALIAGADLQEVGHIHL